MKPPPIPIAYVPVLHQGYIEWFKRHRVRNLLFVLGREYIDELHDGHLEIRAIDPQQIASMITALGLFRNVNVLTPAVVIRNAHFVLPDEVISRRFAEKYLGDYDHEFDPVWLRWDSDKVLTQTVVDCDQISEDPDDQALMRRIMGESAKSADWWRQVGAAVVLDGQVVYEAHNDHVPSPELPYAEGDPRDFVEAGTRSELATALHCEQGIVAWAAREGVKLKGATLVITDFPCPVCAKLVAYGGFREVKFLRGHASLDGRRIMKDQGVTLTQIKQ